MPNTPRSERKPSHDQRACVGNRDLHRVSGRFCCSVRRTGSKRVFVVLIFVALLFLWHTAVCECSRIRIGSYIKEVLERHSDLSWETYLAEWRD